MRRSWIRLLVVLALLVIAFVTLPRLRRPERLPVTVVEAAKGTVAETVSNSRAGTVKARRRAKMSPEIGGRVVAIPFREGDRVRAGEIMLRLEDDQYRVRVRLAEEDQRTAEAERQRACLAAERAERERERLSRLTREGIVSTDALDAAASQAETLLAGCRASQAAADRARAAVEVARVDLGKTVLSAPFDGVVAELSIELGEWTTPSPPAMPVPPVIDLIDPGSIYVSAPMDEVDSARIQPGQRVKVTVDSFRDRVFPGRVLRVAAFVTDVQEQNRTMEIEVELDDATLGTSLLPGTSSDVEVILEERPDVLRIPTSAILTGKKVLVVEGEVLVERSIAPGLSNWDFTEVTSGLAAGDRVVTSLDRPEVKAGALVRVEGNGPQPGGQR
ncbi:MAG TPA: efflux RND transporter periplasmic adaptor subunit [Thermoanaerobaculia bacterium]|nr:efflux RND transporter periplasmic adaptor subunit [Thermoanaerobaculia bacterium]